MNGNFDPESGIDLFRRIFENVSTSIVILDAGGNLLYANNVFLRHVESQVVDLIGSPFEDFLDKGEDKVKFRQEFRELQTGRIALTLDSSLTSHVGRKSYLLWSINHLPGEHPSDRFFVATGIDKTLEYEAGLREQKAEEKTRQYIERVKDYSNYITNIIEMAPIGIWTIKMLPLEKEIADEAIEWHEQVGARILISQVNQEIVSLLGFSKSEIVGRSIFDSVLVDEENAAVYVQEINRRRKQEAGAYEVTLKNARGDAVPVMIKAIPTEIDDQTGLVIEAVGMVIDLTERRRAEKEIARMNTKLREINQDLETSNYHLMRLSFTDSLTGVANRRGFEETLRNEWKRAKQYNSELSLIILDIDHFKAYNDHYGHQAGDDCLVRISQAISSELKRTNDHFSRYGGEEFTIILPATNAIGALQVAEQIRSKVANLRCKHEGADDEKIVTVSLGVATLDLKENGGMDDLIKNADLALYEAKNNGRNRIELFQVKHKSSIGQ